MEKYTTELAKLQKRLKFYQKFKLSFFEKKIIEQILDYDEQVENYKEETHEYDKKIKQNIDEMKKKYNEIVRMKFLADIIKYDDLEKFKKSEVQWIEETIELHPYLKQKEFELICHDEKLMDKIVDKIWEWNDKWLLFIDWIKMTYATIVLFTKEKYNQLTAPKKIEDIEVEQLNNNDNNANINEYYNELKDAFKKKGIDVSQFSEINKAMEKSEKNYSHIFRNITRNFNQVPENNDMVENGSLDDEIKLVEKLFGEVEVPNVSESQIHHRMNLPAPGNREEFIKQGTKKIKDDFSKLVKSAKDKLNNNDLLFE